LALPFLRWLVTSFPQQQTWFEPKSNHVKFVVDEVAMGQGFLEVFLLPWSIFFPLTAPHSSSITQG
jgi:hypothetical protein